jgi:hypothetical protein
MLLSIEQGKGISSPNRSSISAFAHPENQFSGS